MSNSLVKIWADSNGEIGGSSSLETVPGEVNVFPSKKATKREPGEAARTTDSHQ
jgi:hypothetical protein